MPLSEFAMIERYFSGLELAPSAADIVLGVGDDAAVLAVPAGQQLVVAADTLVEAVHFPAGSAADLIGYRALAVNLSDLAAMGAQPRWYTLCLTLPELQRGWLDGFCRGLAQAAAATGISLVGGDTTRGPLTLSVQIMGLVSEGAALTRSGASPGDRIYVTGSLGDAAAGLAILQQAVTDKSFDHLIKRFSRPAPRLREASLLKGVASSCIDISDGLLADLGHICENSAVAARINLDSLPISSELRRYAGAQALTYAANGGDDYELCFTVPEPAVVGLEQQFNQRGLRCTSIGKIMKNVDGVGVQCVDSDGATRTIPRSGYEHFAE
jgi:thiamine-monophosphate kinase